MNFRYNQVDTVTSGNLSELQYIDPVFTNVLLTFHGKDPRRQRRTPLTLMVLCLL